MVGRHGVQRPACQSDYPPIRERRAPTPITSLVARTSPECALLGPCRPLEALDESKPLSKGDACWGGNQLRAADIALAALAAVLAFAGSAFASGGDRAIRVEDACDPTTFDKAIGPGTCVRPEHSGSFATFQDFLDRVGERRAHNAWRFDRDRVTLDAGQELTVQMGRGGEFHTFSEVRHFGPGCVDLLNALVFPDQGPTFTPVTTCPPDPAEGVAPGAPALRFRLSPGTHLFQCAIHPWMRTTVDVRQKS
jgi:hypothetical protein